MTEESLGFQPGTVFRDASGKTLAEQQRQKQEDLDAETLDPRPLAAARKKEQREADIDVRRSDYGCRLQRSATSHTGVARPSRHRRRYTRASSQRDTRE